MQKKFEEYFFFSEPIAHELVVLNSLYYEENTCHRQSMCEQLIVRFFISLTEIFFSEIIPYELVTLNCFYQEEKSFHPQ